MIDGEELEVPLPLNFDPGNLERKRGRVRWGEKTTELH